MQTGRFYLPVAHFYHRLWRDHLQEIGFRVIHVEKLEEHPLWVIRVRSTASAQLHLLASAPATAHFMAAEDPLEHQLQAEVLRMGKTWGPAIRKTELSLARQGAYCTIAFLWPVGKPGRLARQAKTPNAFSFLMRTWLKKSRN
jgi:hypothetical protein